MAGVIRASGLRPIDTGTAPKPQPAGRTCDGCSAPLSRFNPDLVCRLCQVRARRVATRCDEMFIQPIRGSR